MKTREIIKELIPPLLYKFLKGHSDRLNPTWEGIYPNLEAVPKVINKYDSNAEISAHTAIVEEALSAVIKEGKKFRCHHEALGLIAATLIGTPKKQLRVLDFGGSTGLGFVHLRDNLPKNTSLEYHVVDLEGMCAAGRSLFTTIPGIHFHSSIPKSLPQIDLIYLRGVLPYISDPKSTLQELAELSAEYFLLTSLAAGEIPSFAAKQTNLGSTILPYWFLNLGEISETIESRGYNLIYHGLEERAYNQENYPPTHRIKRMRTLLFRKHNAHKL